MEYERHCDGTRTEHGFGVSSCFSVSPSSSGRPFSYSLLCAIYEVNGSSGSLTRHAIMTVMECLLREVCIVKRQNGILILESFVGRVGMIFLVSCFVDAGSL